MYDRAMTFRAHALDSALLWFDPETGATVRVRGPFTRQLVRTSPRVVQVAVTNHCNLACGFCYRDRGAASAWTVDALAALLADLDRAGVLEVAFGGGEPFAWKGFDRLLRRLHEETRLAVSVTTNGVLLDDATLQKIAGTYAQLRLSIYDDQPFRHAIARLRGAHAPFGVNWLVTPKRLPELETFVLDLVARGVTDVLLLSYNGADAALHLDDASARELGARVARLAYALRGRCAVKLSVCFGERLEPVPRVLELDGDCGAGRDFVAITSDRCVQPCSFHHDKVPIESAADVLAAWRDQRRMTRAAQTQGCARLVGQKLLNLPLRKRLGPLERTDIRVLTAFASNNSGSYTLVGCMPTDEVAGEIVDEIARVCDEHSAWLQARRDGMDRSDTPPLHAFAKKHGLALDSGNVGLADDWPEYGPPPKAIAIGPQVLLHVDYTVTMPRLFGELLFTRGGRVSVEHDHAHHPLVAVLSFWAEGMWNAKTKDEVRSRLSALADELRTEVLPKAIEPRRPGDRLIEPAWLEGHGPTVAAIFPDLVEGVALMVACAERHGARVRVDVIESPVEANDPLRAWRSV